MNTASNAPHSHPSNVNPSSVDRESWDDVRARLQQRWGQIDSGDFEQSGTWDEVLGQIQAKTGEARATIEQYASQLLNDAKVKSTDWQIYARDLVDRAKVRMQDTTGGTLEAARHQRDVAGQAIADQLHSAEQAVRQRPMTSLAYAFGLGALIGVMLGSGRRS